MPTAVYSAIPQMTPSQWRSSALPMALTEGLRVVQGQAAILVLSAMVSMADVGKFRVATSLMTLLVLPISVISLVTGPHVSRLAAIGDRRRLRVMLVYSARGMVASVAVLLLPFVLAGNWLIENIFGLEYAGANRIFLMLAIGVLAYALFGAGANALNMLGHQKHVTRASLISVLVLCLLLWPAIVFWGNLGAAAAVSIASALWGVLLWQDIRRLEAMDIGAWAVAGGGSSLPRRGK
ncbi:lipopolysaccharide biosynthesis protein [Thermomonas sp. S9]|uniref:lipopolysaccharide biosynthesis protein n=1 Tax=Thermomonas sp. S9 TaxID=2885203 RepID=UPI00216AD1B0|nr:lipopolysaccharide biosynthesis protein [Thermomonas sp. S9]MCR6496039.1 lipopolysaccharide biosynthesis protein [Thermomonas sp. S9]